MRITLAPLLFGTFVGCGGNVAESTHNTGGGGSGQSSGTSGTSGTAGGSSTVDSGSDAVGGDDCHHSCPLAFFFVNVPKDRVGDVAAVETMGPCGPMSVTESPAGQYFVGHLGVGVCHIVVSFQSGAPSFVTDVKIIPNPGPCCVGLPEPEMGGVTVPEAPPADAATDG